MSSSPSESAAVTLPADPVELPAVPASGSFEIRQRGWLKRLLPQSMFGRSLLLIVMPLVLVQIIAVWVFYARHWETVSRRLSLDVAGDIGLVIEAMKFTGNELELTRLLENASALTNVDFVLERGAALTPETPEGSSLLEEQLRGSLRERVARPFRIDAVSDPRYARIQIELPEGVLAAEVPRKRLSTRLTSSSCG
jgi:two-component system osmolarity sensor histidine kinase EnvZ